MRGAIRWRDSWPASGDRPGDPSIAEASLRDGWETKMRAIPVHKNSGFAVAHRAGGAMFVSPRFSVG